MAVANYTDANGCYPPPYVSGPDGRPWHSWRVLILPYLEEKAVYEAYNFAEPWDGPNNRRLGERMPRQYVFHGFERPGNTTTNYLAVVGDETIWPRARKATPKDVKDGASQTIQIVENRGAGVHWMEPRDLTMDSMDLRIGSPLGVSSPYEAPAVLNAAGFLMRLGKDVSPATLHALLTIDGGENVTEDGAGGLQVLPDGRQRKLRESPQ